jgi:hypothetical protein
MTATKQAEPSKRRLSLFFYILSAFFGTFGKQKHPENRHFFTLRQNSQTIIFFLFNLVIDPSFYP